MGLEAMRRDLKERYQRLLRSSHSGNPNEEPTIEELERRIRNNIIRLMLLGDEIPLKHFAQLKEDLELWEKYRAVGLVPPPPEIEVEVPPQ